MKRHSVRNRGNHNYEYARKCAFLSLPPFCCIAAFVEKAIALDSDAAEPHASRGLSLFISGQFEAAKQEFELAIKLNPNLFDAYYYYGLACSSNSDFEAAEKMFLKAIEVNPADYQAPMFLGSSCAHTISSALA